MYQYVFEFWSYWFSGVETPALIELLCIISVIGLVFGILIFPLIKLFRGKK